MVRGNLIGELHQESKPENCDKGCNYVSGHLRQVIACAIANFRRVAHVYQDVEANDCQSRWVNDVVSKELAYAFIERPIKFCEQNRERGNPSQDCNPLSPQAHVGTSHSRVVHSLN